jgi:hypothetical protein
MERVNQPANEGKPSSWGVARSVHATADRIFQKSFSYVVTQNGARIIAGRGASASAIDALRRNAQAAERDEGENSRREWRDRRRAA